MARYRFSDSGAREDIAKFVDTLCKETPEIAAEMLDVPIKHVGYWLADEHGQSLDPSGLTTVQIAQAPCGCLIGATLIATARLYPEVIDAVRDTPLDEDGDDWNVAGDVSELASAALRVVDGDFGGMDDYAVQQVGMTVATEVSATGEERLFEEFVKNRIRQKLGLTGGDRG